MVDLLWAPVSGTSIEVGHFILSDQAQAGGSSIQRARITAAGKQTSGRLISVDAETLTLLPDGKADPIGIPLSSISAAEMSARKRSQEAAVLTGAGVGVGAGFGIFFMGWDACGGIFRCSHSAFRASVGAGLASGIVSGIVVIRKMGRERWRSVPVASLASLGRASYAP